jgi:hypothetical protein
LDFSLDYVDTLAAGGFFLRYVLAGFSGHLEEDVLVQGLDDVVLVVELGHVQRRLAVQVVTPRVEIEIKV